MILFSVCFAVVLFRSLVDTFFRIITNKIWMTLHTAAQHTHTHTNKMTIDIYANWPNEFLPLSSVILTFMYIMYLYIYSKCVLEYVYVYLSIYLTIYVSVYVRVSVCEFFSTFFSIIISLPLTA